MIYSLLHGIAGLALRWYYGSIDVEGLDRVPRDAPVLLAVNHPNALVDALLVSWLIPRRVVLTAKSTLFRNPVAGALLRWVGVVPLRRVRDVEGAEIDPRRNEEAFRAVLKALARGRAVLIFPEGITHDEPSLAPLRTGAARIALQGVREHALHELRIVPVGITFERKERPRSRVYVQVGEPICVAAFRPRDEARGVEELTAEIATRLRAVTLNFGSADHAARARALASSLARLSTEPLPVGAVLPLGAEVALARKVERARAALETADADMRARVDELLRRLGALEQEAAGLRIAVEDIDISRDVGPGAWFTIREGLLALAAGPIALWGRVNHWIPFHAARLIAMRTVGSAVDPAMRTIVAGTALVLVFYLLQGALAAALAGPLVALAYLVSLPIAAGVDFRLQARLARALRRARAYLLFRRDPSLHARLRAELRWLREEAQRAEARFEQLDEAGSDIAP